MGLQRRANAPRSLALHPLYFDAPGTAPIESASRIGYNAEAMLSVRFTIGLLFVSALLFTAVQGAADDLDQQIAERTRQYQESLRQRAAEISPSFQANIEVQAEQTVADGLEKWNNGEIALCIALPHLAEVQRILLFVTRYFPGFPSDSPVWRAGGCAVALAVTSLQLVLKSSAIYAVNFASSHSSVYPFRRGGEGISYFIRIACTIVQRR